MTDQTNYYRVYAITAVRNFMFDCYDTYEGVMGQIYRLVSGESIDPSTAWVIERHEKAETIYSNVFYSYGVYVDGILMEETETMVDALRLLGDYVMKMSTSTRFSIGKVAKMNEINPSQSTRTLLP